jgi:CRISPR-associated protein Cmr6
MASNRRQRGSHQNPSRATQRPNAATQDPSPNPGSGRSGGGKGGGRGGRRGEQQEREPSPWLEHPLDPDPNPHPAAGFVEYLRWMRSRQAETSERSKTENNGTKLALLKQLEEQSNYTERLAELTKRTRDIAMIRGGVFFEATCPWRIRVGGSRGPESMLLPAFDAWGIPYLPSSTLRGVARAVASRDRQFSEAQIREIFGDVHPTATMGRIVFLDAYPKPDSDVNDLGGLQSDMVNAIWKWDSDAPPQYNTNPSPFLSLQHSTFVIGLCQASGDDDPTVLNHIRNVLGRQDATLLEQVQQWLITGLAQGIGSRVNSGYGRLDANVAGIRPVKKRVILQIEFQLEGQLIHGRQVFDAWELNDRGTNWKSPGKAEIENRPVAFRSMLRYWFRAFGLGVLPPNQVRYLEKEIFGGIEPAPASLGLFRLEIDDQTTRSEMQKGSLILRNSSITSDLSDDRKIALTNLLQSLCWLMFHLGGVGQGARRPYYDRPSSPTLRGATFTLTRQRVRPSSETNLWLLPNTPNDFQRVFQACLRRFYSALETFSGNTISLRSIHEPSAERWTEVADRYCRIVVVRGEDGEKKPYALDLLHEQFHQLKNSGDLTGAKNLCGGVSRDEYTVNGQRIQRGATPSPIWVAKLDHYQVVTIFGVTEDSQNPRKRYLEKLQRRTDNQNFAQLFPPTP